MILERIYVGGALENYNYVLICEQTKKAVVFDPLDAAVIDKVLVKHSAQLQYVVLTHHHFDHYAGAQKLSEHYPQAKIVGHLLCQQRVSLINEVVNDGDVIVVGETLKFNVIYTPGHMDSHISLWEQEHKVIAVGDTIFNAGVGHCRQGSVTELFETIQYLKQVLPDDTLLLTSHDYFQNNLNFAQTLEPLNLAITQKLETLSTQTPETRAYSTIGEEKMMNPFFRLDQVDLLESLKSVQSLLDGEDELAVFSSLRKLRDRW